MRKSLVTAKQPWDLQGSSLVDALADIDNVFGVFGVERIENRREAFERRKPMWSDRKTVGGRAFLDPVGRAHQAEL